MRLPILTFLVRKIEAATKAATEAAIFC